MCELFGFSGTYSIRLNHLLKEFYSHSRQHPHGWGLAVMDAGHQLLEKEAVTAADSLMLLQRLQSPLFARHALAHIRRATIGHQMLHNSHPFHGVDNTGRSWTFVHNGTIFECDALDCYRDRQQGDTDSERLFLCILDHINTETEALGRRLSDEERFRVIDSIAAEVSEQNKVNFLLYDESQLYVHKNCEDTLYSKTLGGGTLFATKPLDEGRWDPVPMTTVLAYRDGQLAMTGTNHGRAYVEDPERMRGLYLTYASL